MVVAEMGSPRLSSTRSSFIAALVLVPSSTVCKVKQKKFFYKHFITMDQCHHTLEFAFHGFSVMGTEMVFLKYQKSGIKSMKECQMGSSLLDLQYWALILTSLLPL